MEDVFTLKEQLQCNWLFDSKWRGLLDEGQPGRRSTAQQRRQ